jgi:hypothetical protein
MAPALFAVAVVALGEAVEPTRVQDDDRGDNGTEEKETYSRFGVDEEFYGKQEDGPKS